MNTFLQLVIEMFKNFSVHDQGQCIFGILSFIIFILLVTFLSASISEAKRRYYDDD